MKHIHTIEEMEKICEQFGQDIESEICEEVKRSLEKCPDCKVQYDNIKKVVQIYRITEQDIEMPEKVSKKLIKSLNLN